MAAIPLKARLTLRTGIAPRLQAQYKLCHA
jgi:hypothetical protein